MQPLTPLEASKALVRALKSRENAAIKYAAAGSQETEAINEVERAYRAMARALNLPSDTASEALKGAARAIVETAEQAQAPGKGA